MAAIDDTQYAFVSDSTGRVTALDIDDLFGGGPEVRGTCQAPPTAFDGLTDPLTDVKAVEENGTVALYVAANRSGFYRLEVLPLRSGDVDLVLTDQVNTPGQAGSLHIVENADAGRLLLVADHAMRESKSTASMGPGNRHRGARGRAVNHPSRARPRLPA